MRISDWSSDVCSSDLQHCEERRSIDPAARFERRWHLRRSNCLRGEPQRSLRVGAGWKSPLYRQSGCNCPLRLSAGPDPRERSAEIVVRIPPLAERHGDVTLLANHFLHKFASEMNSQVKGFSPDALRSEERRVGKECVSQVRSRWAPDH